MYYSLFFACLCYPWVFCKASDELFRNGECEDTTVWKCAGCRISQSNDAYRGRHSLQITNREHLWSTAAQIVRVAPGRRYKASCYVKSINWVSSLTTTRMDFMISKKTNGQTTYEDIGMVMAYRPTYGWVEVGGDFTTEHDVTEVNAYVQIDVRINFLLDHCTLKEIHLNTPWRQQAHSVIENVRKAPLKISISGNVKTGVEYTAEVSHLKSAFAWGTVVNSTYIDDLVHTKYQDFVFNNFEWAITDDAFEWRQTLFDQRSPSYRWFYALDRIRSHGMQVLGKALFWDDGYRDPHWLSSDKSVLRQQMSQHIHTMFATDQNLLPNWIVLNEDLESRYYENVSGNPDLTESLFRETHALDPQRKLFLNNVGLAESDRTTEYRDQGKRFHDKGLPVHAMGVDGNFGPKELDLVRIKYRLSKLSEAGLPLWITQLRVVDPDEHVKANKLKDILTLLFGHPTVQGVMLGSMWDGDEFDPSASITNGNNVVPNAAGRMYQSLVQHQWRTNVNLTIPSTREVSTRAFLGDYSLNIRENGYVIHQEKFTLNKYGAHRVVHLKGFGSGVDILG